MLVILSRHGHRNIFYTLKSAGKNLSSRREVLRIIQVRVNEGADSDLGLAQQKNLVASAEASRAQIIEVITNAKNALAVLLGRAPQDLHSILLFHWE